MKTAIVKYNYLDHNSEGLLIEDSEDLKEYAKIVEKAEKNMFMIAMNSKLDLDHKMSFDHILPYEQSLESALGRMAKLHGDTRNERPIYCLGIARNAMLEGILFGLKRGDKIFVNKNGGFCPITPGVIDLVSIDRILKD